MKAVCRFAALGALLAAAPPAPAQTRTAINSADLRSRLYLYADDSMMGRAAGTEYNLKATAYVAAEARRVGPSRRETRAPSSRACRS